MTDRPDFLDREGPAVPAREYRPVQGSRQGEVMAWLTAVGAAVGTVILSGQRGELFVLGAGLAAFLVATAALLTFGSWLDRNTRIRFDEDQLAYRSPLRRVALTWDRIERLSAWDTGRGWRVQVEGGERAVRFRTQNRLSLGGQELALGIEGGEELANAIRRRAGLASPRTQGGRWICEPPAD